MKACVFHGPGRITVEERPVPTPGPGDILLRVAAAGICHSDIRVFRGEKKARAGVIPGHEIAGVIAAVGQGVEGFQVGDRVVVCPILACGRCFFCQRGFRNRCLARVTLGYEEDGGLAEYMLIPHRLVALGHVLPVPAGLSLEIASLTEPLACVLNSLEVCRLRPGSSLLIVGAGPMGLLHLVLARALGITKVLVSEPAEERLGYARRLGAHAALDPTRNDDLHRQVMRATADLGVDAAVVTVGKPAALTSALGLVRRQGIINLFAGFPPGTTTELDVNAIHYGELSLTGSQNATTDQYRRTLQLLPALADLGTIISHRYTIDQAPQAYAARQEMEGLKSVILFDTG